MVRPKVKSSLLLASQGVGNDAATPSVGLVLASSSQQCLRVAQCRRSTELNSVSLLLVLDDLRQTHFIRGCRALLVFVPNFDLFVVKLDHFVHSISLHLNSAFRFNL